MLKIRRSHDRLIFNMGIPIPGKDGFYIHIETGPCCFPSPSGSDMVVGMTVAVGVCAGLTAMGRTLARARVSALVPRTGWTGAVGVDMGRMLAVRASVLE